MNFGTLQKNFNQREGGHLYIKFFKGDKDNYGEVMAVHNINGHQYFELRPLNNEIESNQEGRNYISLIENDIHDRDYTTIYFNEISKVLMSYKLNFQTVMATIKSQSDEEEDIMEEDEEEEVADEVEEEEEEVANEVEEEEEQEVVNEETQLEETQSESTQVVVSSSDDEDEIQTKCVECEDWCNALCCSDCEQIRVANKDLKEGKQVFIRFCKYGSIEMTFGQLASAMFVNKKRWIDYYPKKAEPLLIRQKDTASIYQTLTGIDFLSIRCGDIHNIIIKNEPKFIEIIQENQEGHGKRISQRCKKCFSPVNNSDLCPKCTTLDEAIQCLKNGGVAYLRYKHPYQEEYEHGQLKLGADGTLLIRYAHSFQREEVPQNQAGVFFEVSILTSFKSEDYSIVKHTDDLEDIQFSTTPRFELRDWRMQDIKDDEEEDEAF